jgi:hypothetical protein
LRPYLSGHVNTQECLNEENPHAIQQVLLQSKSSGMVYVWQTTGFRTSKYVQNLYAAKHA